MNTYEQVCREIERQANRVISDERTHREHPSYITKPMGREHLYRLRGAVELANMVYGYSADTTATHVASAYAAAARWL